MWKKLLKVFFIYSYVTLLFYAMSEELMNVAKVIVYKVKGGKDKPKISFEWYWKTIFKRFKEYFKYLNEKL